MILDGMVLSASGWRGVFAEDGNEESATASISREKQDFAALAAEVFAEYLKTRHLDGTIIIGRDSRPTGPAIEQAMLALFVAQAWKVRQVGVSAAPEIMAYARESGIPFVYISASHNPIGHNGLKFGLGDGAVLEGGEAAKLIAALKEKCASGKTDKPLDNYKDDAVKAYYAFAKKAFLVDKMPLAKMGIAADLNGSARTVSIDKAFFEGLGLQYHAINTDCGKIAHRIVPEGSGLEPCRLLLKELHQKDPSFILGYTPDCDGDRGNLVIWDDDIGDARPLAGQEVFALAVYAELRCLKWQDALQYDASGHLQTKAAVVVNDPTSIMVDRIADSFGLPVFRAEVGEANVVNRAKELRNEGYLVRILGEGPAGGVIIHPSTVRDPLSTVLALVKLLSIEPKPLSQIIAALPRFYSTPSYSDAAILRVKTEEHSLLKKRYQSILIDEFSRKSAELKDKWGISAWEAQGFVGTKELFPLNDFAEVGRGGLRIVLKNADGRDIAAIWMRGSGTEPVFRIMADAESEELEQELLAWQTSMVKQADMG
ncbi:MAG: phosphatidylglycerol lysyltransferase [Spirochaetaceae bacterium]|nr:phosphatidylglycerol lysyltransferase [Spirochaetaceae bacterium]